MAKSIVQQGYLCVTMFDGRTLQLGPWAAGDVVELDEAVIAFVEKDAPGTLRPAGAVVRSEDFSGLTVAELRERLEALGLDSSGRKAELVERLSAATAERQISSAINDRMQRGSTNREGEWERGREGKEGSG